MEKRKVGVFKKEDNDKFRRSHDNQNSEKEETEFPTHEDIQTSKKSTSTLSILKKPKTEQEENSDLQRRHSNLPEKNKSKLSDDEEDSTGEIFFYFFCLYLI